jgi:hypothetical protein
MARRKRWTHTASVKAKVTLAAITGEKTQAELAQLSAARGGGRMIPLNVPTLRIHHIYKRG